MALPHADAFRRVCKELVLQNAAQAGRRAKLCVIFADSLRLSVPRLVDLGKRPARA